MTLQTLLDYLTRTAPPEDNDASATRLLERLRSENAQVRRNAELVLTRMGYEWESFYEEEFVLAILRHLAQSDLTDTLPEVERIVTRGGRTTSKKRVIAAAQVCVEALADKHRESLAKRELLRPSEPAPETLLRPALHAPGYAPDELLRPQR